MTDNPKDAERLAEIDANTNRRLLERIQERDATIADLERRLAEARAEAFEEAACFIEANVTAPRVGKLPDAIRALAAPPPPVAEARAETPDLRPRFSTEVIRNDGQRMPKTRATPPVAEVSGKNVFCGACSRTIAEADLPCGEAYCPGLPAAPQPTADHAEQAGIVIEDWSRAMPADLIALRDLIAAALSTRDAALTEGKS